MSVLERFRVTYLALAALVVGVELYAVFDRWPGNTISEFAVQRGERWRMFWWFLVGFQVWLLIHLSTACVVDGKVRFLWAGRELVFIVLLCVMACIAQEAWKLLYRS